MGNQPVTGRFPSQRLVMQEAFTCNDVIIYVIDGIALMNVLSGKGNSIALSCFSVRYMFLDPLNDVHEGQVAPKLSCGDFGQI